MKTKLTALPPIGMRIIKSSIGVLLGFIIYLIRGRQGAPFYTALSVLWCMQPYTSNAKANAIQRTIGTFIGAFFGLIMILVRFGLGLTLIYNFYTVSFIQNIFNFFANITTLFNVNYSDLYKLE